jgi:aminoglycoside phosphotransferase
VIILFLSLNEPVVIIDHILSEFQNRGLLFRPGDFRYCLISSNRGAIGNDLVFCFKKRENKPRFVVKVGRTPENAKALINEFRWVKFLAHCRKGLGLLPAVHFSGEWHGRTYFVQDPIEGMGLDVALLHWGINPRTRKCLAGAVEFLVDLNLAFRPDDPGRIESASRLFMNHLEALDLNPSQKARIREASEAMGLVSGFTHGDFWATNILIDKKKKEIKGVIDFEFAGDSCYTHFDIFWLVVNLPMFIGNTLAQKSFFPSYQHVFAQGQDTTLYKEIFKDYFEKIGEKMPRLIDLFILSLLYGSSREKSIFGYSLRMDGVCQEMLHWSLDNEAAFKLE